MRSEMEREWAEFFLSSKFPWCWICGRGVEHKPSDWFGPWLIERAHIVNKPRVEDRRAAILACSWCHRVQHGEQLVLPGMQSQLVVTVSCMLYLKKLFDPQYYDHAWLEKHTIGKLPRPRCNREALENYCSRRKMRDAQKRGRGLVK